MPGALALLLAFSGKKISSQGSALLPDGYGSERQAEGRGRLCLKQALRHRLGGAHLPEHSSGRAAPSLRTHILAATQSELRAAVSRKKKQPRSSGALGAVMGAYPGAAWGWRMAMGWDSFTASW